MTRRPYAWLMTAALSLLPAVPLPAAAAEDPAPQDRPARRDAAADDAAVPELVADEVPGEARVASESESSEEPAPAKPEPKPAPAPKQSTSQPRARAKQKPGAPGAATTKPSTSRPTKELSAEEMLSQMLKPQAPGSRPLTPLPEVTSGGADESSGPGAVAPAAPVVNVLREGTFLVDRVGRLDRSADGGHAEFVFESDGTALQDPPVVIIPNLKLMQIEDAAANSTRDLRFRISGMVTEYRGRNYVLLEKAVVVPEILERF